MGCLTIHAATLRGVEAAHVTVEVALTGGLPNITIVGKPSPPCSSQGTESAARSRNAGSRSHVWASRSISPRVT